MKPTIPAQVKATIFLCAGIVLYGACALYEEPEIAPPALSQDLSLVAPEDFPERIKELKGIAENHENPDIRIQARYYTALAYMHYNNPKPDYTEGLANLDEYMSINAEYPREKDETAIWQSVLSQMISSLRDFEKLQKNYAELRRQYLNSDDNRKFLNQQMDELNQTIERQKKEIAGLEDKIKKLDALHAEIEKKKKKK
jgi:uncharacterized coiled-coil DUF342 family protein